VVIEPEEFYAAEEAAYSAADILEPFVMEIPTELRDFKNMFWYGAPKYETRPGFFEFFTRPIGKFWDKLMNPKTTFMQVLNFFGVNAAFAVLFFFYDDILATLFPGTRKRVNTVRERRHQNAMRRRNR
jgi:hypothetical protein